MIPSCAEIDDWLCNEEKNEDRNENEFGAFCEDWSEGDEVRTEEDHNVGIVAAEEEIPTRVNIDIKDHILG